MLLWLIRFFRGWVTFKVNGRFPERFLNLALKSGIGVFGAVPVNGKLTASVIISDYRFIRPVARRSGVKLRIFERHGFPFIINRHKNRWGLAVGAVLFVVISLVLQNFVWTIEVNGIDTISKTAVISSLENNGLYQGKFKHNIDLHKIERELQLEYEEIGWMSVNLLGTCAKVEIKEKTLVPENQYSSDYCNIKAARDGVILNADVRRGTLVLPVGSAVSEGQLLVGGMYENALGELHYVDADADIIAETSRKFEAKIDNHIKYYLPTAYKTRKKLTVLWGDFPVTFAPQVYPFTFYNETKRLYLGDNPVPVSISTQYITSYSEASDTLSPDKAESILNAELALYKLFSLSNVQSFSEKSAFVKTTDGYQLTAEFKCTENIAVKENLIVNPE